MMNSYKCQYYLIYLFTNQNRRMHVNKFSSNDYDDMIIIKDG